MGKAPADQFYWQDWARDLEEHPLIIEGAWIRICCKLWWSETRGEMTKSPIQWARILRVSKATAIGILTYLKNEKIGDVTFRNPKITVACRRMVREEKARQANRDKQSRFRDKKKRFSNPENNQEVTPPSSSSSSSSNKYSPNSIEFGLAKLLLDLILERNPNHKKPDLQKWAIHIDRMIRLDKRAPPEIKMVIRWSQKNDFWQNNILSTEKLRTQYDQLLLKMSKEKKLNQLFGTCPKCNRSNIDLTEKGICMECTRK